MIEVGTKAFGRFRTRFAAKAADKIKMHYAPHAPEKGRAVAVSSGFSVSIVLDTKA